MKTKLLLMLLLASFSIYSQTNLVSNGDFETWTPFSQPTDWNRFFNGLLYQDADAQKGLSSTKMEITSGTLHFMNSSPFAIQTGKTYRVTMYHKLVSGTFSSVELSLTKSDAFKTAITKKVETSTVNSEWRKIEFDYVATTSQNAEISIWVTGTTGAQILVDNVSIIDAAEIGPKYTLIPDVNFENALIELGIDSGTPDGKVLTSNVATVTSLPISSKNITDLTGIQDFKDLSVIYGYYNQLTSLDVSNNTNLTTLYLDGNKLTTLDISKNTKLTTLTFDGNKIESLDLSFTPLLTELSMSSNPISSLDVSNLKLLRQLSFQSCEIATLDLSNNKDLISLLANRNKLTTLNLSENKQLVHLSCYSNSLTALDVNANTKLEYLNFSTNPVSSINLKLNANLKALVCVTTLISTLDLSNNKFLIGLNCQNNVNLTELNLKNGNNTNLLKSFTYVTGRRGGPEISSFQNNLKFSCIQVDDVAYSNANWSTLTPYPALFTTDCASLVYTLIPDTNFEIKLMTLGIDKDGKNGKVLTSSIANVTSLNLSDSKISNLTGIQDFKDLETLNCSKNLLTSLDISSNTLLSTLNFSGNSLTGLNTAQNTQLTYFIGSDNKLATLSLTNNKKLKQVQLSNNLLTSLSVNSNTLLEDLNLDKNTLSNLNITTNTALKTLSFTQNQITAILLTQNTLLTDLTCWGNKLTALDVSKNTALVSLYCDSNKITTLNLSANTNLIYLTCASNSLTELNLKNGNNTKISKNALDLRNNPNLTCIQVDNISHSNTNWSLSKDAAATFNVDCTVYTLIPDLNFEKKLIALGYDSGVEDGKVATFKISGLTSLNISNSSIANLTGIQDFAKLRSLDCRQNNLTTLDLSKNLALESLNCTFNSITTINVTKNVNLTDLYCSNNKLKTINTSENKLLKSLVCFVNEINSLDVTSNPSLTTLSCATNNIKVLDVSNNPNLGMLSVRLNGLSKLDLSKCPALYSLDCFANSLKELNLKNGSNNLITNNNINLAANSGLTCISVDNVSDANTNWGNKKDATASFSNNCTLGIEDAIFDKVVMYPNPTKGEININNITLEKATVYNSLGQLVKSFVFNSGDTSNIINLSGLPKGIYYVYLINDDAASARKVIVE